MAVFMPSVPIETATSFCFSASRYLIMAGKVTKVAAYEIDERCHLPARSNAWAKFGEKAVSESEESLRTSLDHEADRSQPPERVLSQPEAGYVRSGPTRSSCPATPPQAAATQASIQRPTSLR